MILEALLSESTISDADIEAAKDELAQLKKKNAEIRTIETKKREKLRKLQRKLELTVEQVSIEEEDVKKLRKKLKAQQKMYPGDVKAAQKQYELLQK